MNNQDVANQLGISRQAVHNSLKNSIPKIYNKFKQKYGSSGYETLVCLLIGLNISTEKDMKSIFNYLPKEEQNEIKEEIIKIYPNLKD